MTVQEWSKNRKISNAIVIIGAILLLTLAIWVGVKKHQLNNQAANVAAATTTTVVDTTSTIYQLEPEGFSSAAGTAKT